MSAVIEEAPTSAPASAVVHDADGRIVLAGDWVLEQPTPRFVAVIGSASSGAGRSVSFDATGLGEWDSSVLIFLLQAQDWCEEHDAEFDPAGLPERITRLLTLARAVPDRIADDAVEPVPYVARLGARGIAAWESWLEAVAFTGAVAESAARLAMRRTKFRWREFWVV